MPISRVVIVGDGLAAWLCAGVCARAMSRVAATVHVISVSDIISRIDTSLGAPLAAESSLPAVVDFNRHFGFDEDALIRSTFGGYTLGSVLSEWKPGTQIFNPFGQVGSVLGPVSFPHLVYRLREMGQSVKFANYSLAALCAQAGRFAKVMRDNNGGVLATLEYGLHIDVSAYTQALKADAIAHGVFKSVSRYQGALLDESGYIDAVNTENGERIEGDLFIDCTGAARLLVGQVHNSKFTGWTQWMPCNRIVNSMVPTDESPQPYTHLIAHPSGWARTISLPGRRSESFCFHDAFHAENISEACTLTSGFYSSPWQKNCVALGGATAVLDPTPSLSLQLLCSAIHRLIDLFPSSRQCEQESIEFNRQIHSELECARDYGIAHYKLNGRIGEPFWDACRNMSIPDSLSHRVAVYNNCGRVVMHDGEMVDRMNWITLFDAQGIQPQQYDVVARGIPTKLINEHLAVVRRTFLNAVVAMPSYQAYLHQMR